eukprot:gb/GFBE01058239.1/.p1 GENE.gb/GFBE01058239.1/~~gb/GFBE01058239.1/.p1  ORF type:complete len:596 (+),score=138.24 gb/GFBE01058239.1/:1-1788(+)
MRTANVALLIAGLLQISPLGSYKIDRSIKLGEWYGDRISWVGPKEFLAAIKPDWPKVAPQLSPAMDPDTLPTVTEMQDRWTEITKYLAGDRMEELIPGKFIVKLKANHFVDDDTSIVEVGQIRLIDDEDNCYSCDHDYCTSPHGSALGTTPEMACQQAPDVGDRFVWNKPFGGEQYDYDIMITVPAYKLGPQLRFGIEIVSGLDHSGRNDQQRQAMQVTEWFVTATLSAGTKLMPTKSWIRMNVGIYGDFAHAVMGDTFYQLPVSSSMLAGDTCTSPAPEDRRGYIIQEHSMKRWRMRLTLECKEGYVGTPKFSTCREDKTPYRVRGCKPEHCIMPLYTDEYDLNITSLDLVDFDIKVSCKNSWAVMGNPYAAICTEHGQPFTLHNCHGTTTTTTPVDLNLVLSAAMEVELPPQQVTEQELVAEAMQNSTKLAYEKSIADAIAMPAEAVNVTHIEIREVDAGIGLLQAKAKATGDAYQVHVEFKVKAEDGHHTAHQIAGMIESLGEASSPAAETFEHDLPPNLAEAAAQDQTMLKQILRSIADSTMNLGVLLEGAKVVKVSNSMNETKPYAPSWVEDTPGAGHEPRHSIKSVYMR